jgi:general secretion pathway protein B
MSFILDALKKSEQERRRREVPDIHTEHAPVPARRSGISYWPFVIGFALLLNAGLLLWWLRPWQPPAIAEEEAPVFVAEELAPEPVPITVLPLPEAEPALKEPPPLPPAVQPVPERVEPAPVREVVASAPMAASPPPRLGELPPSLRAELPELAITLHFFTDEPASRMVRINGQNLREGQQLNPNLALQGITPEGVVLNLRGQLFSVPR